MIGHNQVKSKETLTRYIRDGPAIYRNSSPAKTATRFLIITMPGSFQSNVTKTLE